MRLSYFSSCFLMCSLSTCMQIPVCSKEASGTKEELASTATHLLGHQDWGSAKSDISGGNELRSVQPKLSADEIIIDIPGSSPTTSLQALQKVDKMNNSGKASMIEKEKEKLAAKCSASLLKEVDTWSETIEGLGLPESEVTSVKEVIADFREDTRSVLFNWKEQFEDKSSHLIVREVREDHVGVMIETSKRVWIKSFLRVGETLNLLSKDEKEDDKIKILKKGYELIFNSLIELKKIELLSKEEISNIVKEGITRQMILAYDTINQDHLEQSEKTADEAFNIGKLLETNEVNP